MWAPMPMRVPAGAAMRRLVDMRGWAEMPTLPMLVISMAFTKMMEREKNLLKIIKTEEERQILLSAE